MESKYQGLSSKEVQERVNKGQTNKTILVVGKSVWEIIASNFLSLFNIVLYVVAGLLIYAQQWTSLFFMVILLANVVIGLIEDLYARHLMKKTKIMTRANFKVLRNKKEIEIKSDDIVIDDIIIIREGEQIPVDGEVVDGIINVNESQLTGESKTIDKNVGDKVYSGSFVTGGYCYIKATAVGNNSYIQQLSLKAKKFKRTQSEILRNFKILFRFISAIVISLMIAMAIVYAVQGKFGGTVEEVRKAIGAIAGSVVAMIPTGLYLLTSTALAVGVITLYKKRAAVQELYSIEMLARSNILCVDKTGTITDGTMSVSRIIGYSETDENKIKQALANLLAATKDANLTAQALKKVATFEPTLIPSQVIPFNSKNKYSAASFGTRGTYVLGAIDFINILNKQGYKMRSQEFTSKGQRVLALAYSPKQISGQTFEEQCQIMALIILKDNIKPDALATFEWFKGNGVQIKVISGDDPETVSEIAKSVGIPNADRFVSLQGKSDEEVAALAEEYNIFGRVSPEQKETLVLALKAKKNTVAMTGDGVNDILALKRADCSIAMASGSEAARNVSHIVLLDSDFSRLPEIVGEGRRVINNLQRTASVFLTKTIFAMVLTLSFLILSIFQKQYSYPFVTNNMYIWDSLGIGIPAFFIALQPNRTEVSTKSFLKTVITNASISSIFPIAMVAIFFSLYFIQLNGFGYFGLSNVPYTGLNGFEGATVGYAQTVAMCVSAFSLFSLVVLMNVCFPFDKYRALVLSVAGAVSILVFLIVGLWSYNGAMENNILRLGLGYLNSRNWLILMMVIVLSITTYLFINHIIRIFRRNRINDQSK